MVELPDSDRIQELRDLGLSDPVVRTAHSEVLHECLLWVFLPLPNSFCIPVVPAELRFVPLWHYRGGVTGILVGGRAIEYVDYAIEHPEDGFEHVAHTEQGLLAFHLLEEPSDKWLEEAARVLGFHFLNEIRNARLSGENPAIVVARIDSMA